MSELRHKDLVSLLTGTLADIQHVHHTGHEKLAIQVERLLIRLDRYGLEIRVKKGPTNA